MEVAAHQHQPPSSHHQPLSYHHWLSQQQQHNQSWEAEQHQLHQQPWPQHGQPRLITQLGPPLPPNMLMQQAQMLAQMQTHVLDQLQEHQPGIEALRVAYNRGVQDTTERLGANGSKVVKRTRQVRGACEFAYLSRTYVTFVLFRHASILTLVKENNFVDYKVYSRRLQRC